MSQCLENERKYRYVSYILDMPLLFLPVMEGVDEEASVCDMDVTFPPCVCPGGW